MKPRDIVDALLLGALWGGSFLFMRVAGPEFGPFALMMARCGIAALILTGIVVIGGRWAELRRALKRAAFVGLFNSALPFALWGYALIHLPAGYGSILNAATPMFAALVAWVWFRDRLAPQQAIGVAIGFVGVFVLSLPKLSAGLTDLLPVLACLLATLCYGIAAGATKRFLTGVAPVVSATGSQLGAGLFLMPPALFTWPANNPSALAWSAAVGLAVACTALAFLLYFRLAERIGPQRASTVTYLIPVFGVLWGAVFLGETLRIESLIGGLIVLFGSAMATGLLRFGRRAPDGVGLVGRDRH